MTLSLKLIVREGGRFSRELALFKPSSCVLHSCTVMDLDESLSGNPFVGIRKTTYGGESLGVLAVGAHFECPIDFDTRYRQCIRQLLG